MIGPDRVDAPTAVPFGGPVASVHAGMGVVCAQMESGRVHCRTVVPTFAGDEAMHPNEWRPVGRAVESLTYR